MTKTNKPKNKLPQQRIKRTMAFFFAAVFGIIGLVTLYRSLAASPRVVIFSEEYIKPLMVEKDGRVYKRNYQDIGFQLFDDGTLVCGDGSNPDKVFVTSLSKKDKNKVMSELEQSGFADEEDANQMLIEPGEVMLGDDLTGITYNKAGQRKMIVAPGNKPRNKTVQKIHTIGQRACKKATRQISRDDAPVPDERIIDSEEYEANGSTTNLKKITMWLRMQAMPRVEAGSYGPLSEAKQYELIDSARARKGLKTLGRHSCLHATARLWSYTMSTKVGLVHSAVPQYITYVCGGGWRSVGENVGWAGCPSGLAATTCSKTLYNAFAASPGHAANMFNANYTHYAVGAYRDSSKLWITHHFIQY
jgi:uncharacterized protein YkwD